MKTQIAVAVLMLAFTAIAQTSSQPGKPAPQPSGKTAAPAQQEPSPALFKGFGNYGGWWNRISETEKDSFLDGYMTAMRHANSVAVSTGNSFVQEAQPGAADYNQKFYGGMYLVTVGETFAYSADKPLKPKLDEFYKESLNARIPVQLALEHIRDEMSGKKTAGQLVDELNGWRKVVNH
jgi:hypothetical protein